MDKKTIAYLHKRIHQEVEFLHELYEESVKQYKYVNNYLEGQLAAFRRFDLWFEEIAGEGVFNPDAFLEHYSGLIKKFRDEMEKEFPKKK